MATPPVCKLMDYGRFKYEQSKKENEARKHQKVSELKEIRLSPRTDDHDLSVKVRKIEEFLSEGDKVKVGVRFRGRELAHPELGRQLLDKIIAGLKSIAVVERPAIMEGKIMSLIVTRAPGWEPPKKVAPVPRSRKNSHGPATQASATDDASAETEPSEPLAPVPVEEQEDQAEL